MDIKGFLFSLLKPAAPSGSVNLPFQYDVNGPNVSVSVSAPVLVGDSGSGGSAGLAPSPVAGDGAAKKWLKATGAWLAIVASDLVGAIFGASGATHSAGAVPDPGSSAGTTRYLREDATWAAPAGSLVLKHDGTLNGSQTLLNLKGSTSVAIADDGSGGLTLSAVGPNVPPVVRGWNKASGSGTSATVALTGLSAPGGGTASAVAGDLAILNIGMAPPSLTTPSGWTLRTSGTGASWNGYTFSRVLSSGDIGTGSISVTLSGSSTPYDVHLLVVQSSTYSSIREAVSGQSTGTVAGGNPVTPTTSSAVVAGDLGIYFGTNEFIFSGLGETLSRGSVVQTSTNGDNIGVSATEAIATAGAVAVTFTAGTNSVYGHYGCIVIVIGLATAVGNGTVTSVGLSMPSDFTVSGSPVTGAGTFTVTGGVSKSGVQQELYTYAADTGSANAYAVTLSPAPTLVAGSEVCFKAVNANTGASTLAVNGGTATAIKKNGNSTALASGDIAAAQIVTAKYDGTVWQILVPGSGGTSPVMVASGASHAAGLAPDPGATAGSTKFLREDATWAVPAGGGGGGGGALVLLEQHTAAASASLAFTGWQSASYNTYLIDFLDIVPSTSGLTLNLQVSTDGGATYDATSGHYYTSQLSWGTGGVGAGGPGSGTSILLAPFSGRTLSVTASTKTAGQVTMMNPGSGALFTAFTGKFISPDSATASNPQTLEITAGYQVVTAINAFKVTISSGTFTGVIRVYGIANS